MEAGEKPMSLEEDLVLPPGKADMEQLLYYRISPSVREKKVMADKLIFRGAADLHVVYLGTDGMMHTFRAELPMSQFTELEREYGSNAERWVEPAVTNRYTSPFRVAFSPTVRVPELAFLLGSCIQMDLLTPSMVPPLTVRMF